MDYYGSPQPHNADNAAEAPAAATAPEEEITPEVMTICNDDASTAPAETPPPTSDEAAPPAEEPNESAASDDETDAPDATETAATDYAAGAAAAVVSELPNEPEAADTATEVAEHVSNHPILNEITAYSHQLQRIITLCRCKIAANCQAHTTIVGLDAALAHMPSNTTSIVNTMLDMYKSLIVQVPNSHELFDIEATREDVFRFYNLEHILATRCRRRSQRLASK